MDKTKLKSLIGFVCFGLLLLGLNGSSVAQDKTELYEEIAGHYEYEFEGQVMVIRYWVEEGVLLGTAEGDPDPPSKLDPVEGEEMTFEATGGDGNLYVISFSRDEEGKITKSTMAVMGIEIEGVRIK